MKDETEATRRGMVAMNAAFATDRAGLEARHGKVWGTDELGHDFEVLGFMAPLVVVRRKSDDAKGSLAFQHRPRFYFSFEVN